jgi:glycosyltransferase involved in cell wall biosynthesis
VRILFVSPFPPSKDGIGKYTQTIMTAVRAAGHETRVIVPRVHPGHSDDVIGALSAAGRLDLAALRDAASDWSADLIHVQFAVAAFGTRTRTLLAWLGLVRATTSIPVVATMHEVTRDTALLRGLGRSLYGKLSRLCDHVIVHTNLACAVLTGPVGTPTAAVSVISHPDIKPPSVISSPAYLRQQFNLGDRELLLAFGFIHVDKGLGDLITALSILRKSGIVSLDGIRLVIAGAVRPRLGLFRVFELRDRIHFARVLHRSHRAGLGDNVVLTGYVPEDDIAGWFKAAAGVVLPYRRTEQSGVASLANAFGVPVLASKVGGLAEQYASSPWLFSPRNPPELASVLARFVSTPPQQRALPSEPRTAAEMETVLDATLSIYRAVVQPMVGHPIRKSQPHAT